MSAGSIPSAGPPGVLLLTDDFPVGGLERIVVGLAGELLARGHRVGVLANAGGAMWDGVPAGVERFETAPGPTRPLRILRRLRVLARSGRYPVLHAHQRGVALLARIAALGTTSVVVEHVHNVFRPTPVARLLSFHGQVLVACAPEIARMLVQDFHRPVTRVRTVVNGVADPGARPLREADGVLRLLGAGRLSEQKDPLRFVRTVAALAAVRGPGTVHATWLGDGELMPDVQAERTRLGLEAVLSLPGLVDDVADRIAAADCLLLTSRHEGLPLVALEALAVGRGAVLPDVGGCGDAIDAETGLLYPPDLGIDELTALLDATLGVDRLHAWAGSARDRYVARFTFERMAEQILEIYGEVVPRPQSASRAATMREAR